MNEKRQKHSIAFLLGTTIIALIGGVLFYLLIDFHGIGISPDSVSYLATAKNIASGKGLIDYNNSPLVLFPAVYPFFLSLITKLTGSEILTTAKGINALLFASLILFYGLIINKFNSKNNIFFYKLIVLISIPLSFSMLDVYTMLWSETLFIVFIPVFILTFYRYIQFPTITNLMITSFITAIACDTRIAGISIIGTGIAMIALQKNFSIKKKIIDGFSYLVISSCLIVLNVIRNSFLSGTIAGIRQKSETSLFANIQLLGYTIIQWFHFPITNNGIALFLGILVMSYLMIYILKIIFRNKDTSSIEIVITLFCFLYFGFIILSSTLSKYEPINNRLLSPAFIPCLISLTIFAPLAVTHIKARYFKLTYMIIIALLIILFEESQISYCKSFFDEIKENGIPGYTETDWDESEIVQFLKNRKQLNEKLNHKIPIYSNAADAVYFYSNLSATSLPETVHTNQLTNFYGNGANYIIWFTNEFDYKAIVRLEEVELHRHLDTVKIFKDGYLLISKPFLR